MGLVVLIRLLKGFYGPVGFESWADQKDPSFCWLFSTFNVGRVVPQKLPSVFTINNFAI